MITAQERMSVNAFINRTQKEFLSFMEIDCLPEMTRAPFEIDAVQLLTQGLASWAQVFYDPVADKYTLKVLKNLYVPVMHADYLMFHEYTHAYDIERLAKKDKMKYASIKGYMEYHASQVELLKQVGANKYSSPISFSMTDVVKSPGEDRTVYETMLARKKDATDAIMRAGFPGNIEILAMTVGIIFNHLGRVSVCKRYAKDYDVYKTELEDYNVEEQFFGADAWKLITGLYHDEMAPDIINIAMMCHLGILKSVTQKYGLNI